MASTNTSGKHRLDHDIEKYRLELNWTKILDKLKTMKVSGKSNRSKYVRERISLFIDGNGE